MRINSREDYKIYMGNNGVYDSNLKMVANSETCKLSIKVYFILEGQIALPSTVTVGKVLNEGNVV
jgi:hypothetical protein